MYTHTEKFGYYYGVPIFGPVHIDEEIVHVDKDYVKLRFDGRISIHTMKVIQEAWHIGNSAGSYLAHEIPKE